MKDQESPDYEAMLDELASEYPELAKEAEALQSSLAEAGGDEDMEYDDEEEGMEFPEEFPAEEEDEAPFGEMDFPEDEEEEEEY